MIYVCTCVYVYAYIISVKKATKRVVFVRNFKNILGQFWSFFFSLFSLVVIRCLYACDGADDDGSSSSSRSDINIFEL